MFYTICIYNTTYYIMYKFHEFSVFQFQASVPDLVAMDFQPLEVVRESNVRKLVARRCVQIKRG